jgi:hypothetical protein
MLEPSARSAGTRTSVFLSDHADALLVSFFAVPHAMDRDRLGGLVEQYAVISDAQPQQPSNFPESGFTLPSPVSM